MISEGFLISRHSGGEGTVGRSGVELVKTIGMHPKDHIREATGSWWTRKL